MAVIGFALTPPLLSHDVYSYVDYARLGVLHGIDPYLRGPAAAPADPAFAHVTWPHTPSAYGPLFTLATYPLAWLPVSAAVWALKGIAAASVLGLAAICARLAPSRGIDPLRAAAFVALNPLVLVHVVGGPHNDALAMLLVMIGVAAVLSNREVSGGAALVAAFAIKVSTAFAAPFALLGSARRPRFLIGALAALAATVAAAHLAFGWNWLNAIGLAGENQSHTSHLSIPTTFARIAGAGKGPARVGALTLYAALIAYLLAWTYRGNDWLRAAAWSSLGLLLATSWLLPWYLIWPLPLAALS
ncbi:MAG TPA: polyprenol phosphomannose-dependent alpha 1,6 mannosyltransferase MptB, partial [Solirubrobacterales bacterium]|nr:polyprenol phosphomannose-dependent alpha 1,6 mannosyltransferase MptB [Solirubrobacterales bacterium]